jgi:hypothetical protein
LQKKKKAFGNHDEKNPKNESAKNIESSLDLLEGFLKKFKIFCQ